MEVEKLMSKLSVGQKVIVKLPEKIVVGELLLKKIPSHVRLKDCFDYESNEKLGSNNIYYMNEIREIRVWRICETEEQTRVTNEMPQNDKSVDAKDKLLTKLSEEKYQKIRKMLDSRIFIDRYDFKYFEACREIMKQRQVGVCFEDLRFGRKSNPSVLAIATDMNVYIFDLLLLDGINKELKAVFESSSVCKIIHYSKMTCDYLHNTAKIKVRFIFDTLMAYFYISGTREVLTVAELISNLFNLPNVTRPKDLQWHRRPISEEIVSQMGFSVGFLVEIQQYLMHRHLLKSFYDASGVSMNQFSNNDEFPYEVKLVNEREVVKGLKNIRNDDETIDLREIKHESTTK